MNVYRMYPEYEQSKSAGIAQILAAALQAYSQGKDKKRKQGQEDERLAFEKESRLALADERRAKAEQDRRETAAREAQSASLEALLSAPPQMGAPLSPNAQGPTAPNPAIPQLYQKAVAAQYNPYGRPMTEGQMFAFDQTFNPEHSFKTAAMRNNENTVSARRDIEERKAKARDFLNKLRAQAEARKDKVALSQISNYESLINDRSIDNARADEALASVEAMRQNAAVRGDSPVVFGKVVNRPGDVVPQPTAAAGRAAAAPKNAPATSAGGLTPEQQTIYDAWVQGGADPEKARRFALGGIRP